MGLDSRSGANEPGTSVARLLRKSRSYRRFREDRPVERRTLVDLVELARWCPSSGNRQPLKFLVASGPEECARVFPHLTWAALIDWPGPSEGQRPTGYIVILGDKELGRTFDMEAGIVAQSMLLAAAEQGLGGCMFGSVGPGLRREWEIPDRLEIVLVLALGLPAEVVVLDDMTDPTAFAYWRDENDVHHVPKRPLGELLVDLGAPDGQTGP
jgi:nitroreductase